MKNQLSEEQLDQILRNLISDATVDDSELDNIAESPSIWWGVQRNINQKASPWPPPTKWWRAFFIGVPSMAAMILVVVFVFLGGTADVKDDQAKIVAASEQPTSNEPTSTQSLVSGERQLETRTASIDLPLTSSTASRTHLSSKEKRISGTKSERLTAAQATKEPIKTDFIALSYAENPDSGQIVRVKVPSSMMVTLGLVASVKQPSSLVDAEVLVGDDGLTHSIRFIRKAL